MKTPTGFSSFTVADGTAYTIIQEEIEGDLATGKAKWEKGDTAPAVSVSPATF